MIEGNTIILIASIFILAIGMYYQKKLKVIKPQH